MAILEWIAGGFILTGLYFYGKKNLWGPGLSAVGCLLWMGLGIFHGMWSLALLNAVLLATNSYNLALWWNGSQHIVLNGETLEGGADERFKRKVV